MHTDLFKIIGIVVLGIFLLFIFYKCAKFQSKIIYGTIEGLTGMDSSSTTTTTNTNNNETNGVAGNASSYSAKLKALNIQSTYTYLITKNRTDYENIIINLEEYINLLMLDVVLNIDTSNKESVIKAINNLGTLNTGNVALNNVMKYIDSK